KRTSLTSSEVAPPEPSREPSPYGSDPVASRTPRTRSQPTTLRGSSPSTQPSARIGHDSSVNRYATFTRSPGDIAPVSSRTDPASSTARTPRLGSASSTGSNSPRILP